ncbi:MAG: hypothetical protein IPK60_08270 [Sandaracinaceae bacterium]|nr:hypothetical protein [Sandaracinaceae bacterium]
MHQAPRFWTALLAMGLVVLQTNVGVAPAYASPARSPRVSVGEIGSPSNRSDAAHALRAALVHEIAAMRNVELSSSGNSRFVVRGSVTRLDNHRVEDGLVVQCEVSLVVAESRNGSVRMMLRGHADARGDNDRIRLEDAALSAAVRGAVRPLAQSLSRIH